MEHKELELTVEVKEDGRIELTGLPVHRGDKVKVRVSLGSNGEGKRFATARDWLNSGLVGMWADREDMADPVEWVNQLRENEEHRGGVWDDSD